MRIPKTIRWISLNAFILLALLTVYRIIILSVFGNFFSGLSGNLPVAFTYGVRFDIQLLATFSLFMFVISLWPNLHFFKWNTGKYTALALYTIFIFIILFFCLLDFLYINHYSQRVQGTIVSDIAKATGKWNKLSNGPVYIAGFAIVVVITGLFTFTITALHRQLSKSKIKDKRATRTYAQIGFAVICIAGIWGRVAIHMFNSEYALEKTGPVAYDLAINPVASFISTLPARSDDDK